MSLMLNNKTPQFVDKLILLAVVLMVVLKLRHQLGINSCPK
jgi:hypothetical protein